jgi:hypothetical protein
MHGRQLNTSIGFIIQEEVLRREYSARDLEPTVTYRLGDRYRSLLEKPQEDHWVGKFSMAL